MTAKPVGAALALLLGLLGIGAALPSTTIDAVRSAVTQLGTVSAGSLQSSGSDTDDADDSDSSDDTDATSDSEAAEDAITDGVVSVTVAPDTVGMPAAGEELHLTITISNRTDADIESITVDTNINRSRLTSSSTLSDWLTSADGSVEATTTVATTETTTIASGETRIVTIAVPDASLGIPEEGVYALGVRLLSGSDVLAHARTALTWKSAATALNVAVAAALVLPDDAPGLLDSATLAEYTARGGLLSEQLDALLGTQVAIGIDPRILASIRILGQSAPESAVAWLEQLRSASNPTFPLSYADSDIALPLAVGTGGIGPTSFNFAIDASLFQSVDDAEIEPPAQEPSPTTETPLPPTPTMESLTEWNYTYPDMVWPAADTVTAASFTSLAASGSPLLLSSDNVAREISATTSAVTATVDGSAVAVSDARVSALLQAAVSAETTAEWNAAMAELSSTVAVSSETATGASTTILATLARSWSDSGYRLEQTLAALYGLAWATPAALASTLDTTATAPTLATIVDGVVDQERVDTLAALLTAEAAEAQFATITADPLALTAARRLDLLALLSNSWLDDATGWATATSDFLDRSAEIRDSVSIAPSSTVQLPADRGSLPVTVNNNLDQEVTVYVNVRAHTPVLSVEEQYVELVIEPNSSKKAQIPVVSLANGQVTLSVSVFDQPGGNQIGNATTVKLNVHAGWETAGTVIFGAFVVIIFTIGIIRTVRKRRKATRTAE